MGLGVGVRTGVGMGVRVCVSVCVRERDSASVRGGGEGIEGNAAKALARSPSCEYHAKAIDKCTENHNASEREPAEQQRRQGRGQRNRERVSCKHNSDTTRTDDGSRLRDGEKGRWYRGSSILAVEHLRPIAGQEEDE